MDQPDHSRAKIIISIAIIALIIAAFFAYRDFVLSRQFRVIFFDVGQGDAALVRLPSGAKMLIDCGPNNLILHKLGRYLDFFDRQIDYLVISHPDKDHYGGCIDVLKRYNVKNIFENGDTEESGGYWPSWQNTIETEGAEHKIITDKYIIKDGEAEIIFLEPTSDLGVSKKDNNQSLVMRLVYATTSFLFTGDIEEERENELVNIFCPNFSSSTSACAVLQSDYLKVAHHGSIGSFSDNFYRAINPKVAVISVGKNSYGHPSTRVIKNFQRFGAIVWRTDEMGDILIK